jgi:hypothetical protein
MKQRRSCTSKASNLKRSYNSLICIDNSLNLFGKSTLMSYQSGRKAAVIRVILYPTTFHVECVEIFSTSGNLIEFSNTENFISKLVIWVTRSPRTDLLLGVSLSLLSGRLVRDFIFGNFLFLLIWNGWRRFLKGFLTCYTWCKAFIFGKFLFQLLWDG